jgi:hypothetical protein
MDDRTEIVHLLERSQLLLDEGHIEEMVDVTFVDEGGGEDGGLVPEADFGFDVWRGRARLLDGYRTNTSRFEALAHVPSPMVVDIDGDRAVARYHLQAWQWLLETKDRGPQRGADFLAIGIMTDDLARQGSAWGVTRRQLRRLGPGVAVGGLPDWLSGLGSPTPS